MADLFGASGVLEQLFLWSAASQVVSSMAGPAMTALTEDMNGRHPLASLAPDVAAQAVAHSLMAAGEGRTEAARGGISAARFDRMVALARARVQPADLAAAVVRGIVPLGDGERGAALSGMDATAFKLLRDLARVHLPPAQLAQAVTLGMAPEGQAAAEAALQGIDGHWFGVLRQLAQPRLPPAQLADAVTRGMVGEGQAADQAALQGIDGHWFGVLRQLGQPRLPPAQLADALTRGIVGQAQAADQAALQGIDGHWFGVLRQLAQPRLPPANLAQAVEHNLVPDGQAADQAALQGIDGHWFGVLRELQRVRLAPADLATAVLRSYLTADQAQAEATPQGVSAAMLRILSDLAGDAPGPQQAVEMLLRGIIHRTGKGAASTSYEQAIAEGRLHDKWADPLAQLGKALLSPADAASAVIRNFVTAHQGEQEAAKSGVSAELFTILRHLAGDAPAPGQLAEALRRGLIELHGTGAASTSFDQGIAEGRLADKWTDMIRGLAKLWPTPVDALNAALKGQVTEAEGRHLYELLGGDLQFYTWLLDSQGEGPTPLQAADWARRGIIPWDGTGPHVTSYAQAVRESRFRDKWAGAYKASIEYVPPPETVRTLLEQGAIDRQQAAAYWRKDGLSEADITAYLHAAEFNNLAATRGLAVNEVLNLYYSQVIDERSAAQLLELFHVPQHTADLLIRYTLVRRDIAAVNSAVARVRSLIAARKIGAQTARQALERLKIPGPAIDGLIASMEVEASISVKTLTQAEIVDAWDKAVMSDDEAIAELTAIGYTPYDAWVLLSVKAGNPLPNKPDRNVAPPPGAVIPGVT